MKKKSKGLSDRTDSDSLHGLREMTESLCEIMGWEKSESHKFEIIRQTCSGKAAALSVEKGNEIVKTLEILKNRCNYFESRIIGLSLMGAHISVNDCGDWTTVGNWAKEVLGSKEDLDCSGIVR